MSLTPSMERVAVVALFLVLAGCGSVGAPTSDPGTVTVTPAPVPAGTPVPGGDTLAPGLAADGVFDSGRLAAAHGAALAGRSFTLVRTDSRYTNGTLSQRDRSVLVYGADGRRFSYDLRQTDRRDGENATSRIRRYADGERVYVAVTRGNETTYDLLRASDGTPYDPSRVFPANATNERGLARLFVLLDARVTDEWTVDGRTVYRVATPDPQTVPPLRNITFAANVTETGLVRSYYLEYDVTRATGPVRVVANTTYRDVGTTTVSEPPWVASARGAVANRTDTGTPQPGLSAAPGA